MSSNDPYAPTRVIPDTGTETDKEPRLAPDKLCPEQQGRVVRRIIRELP